MHHRFGVLYFYRSEFERFYFFDVKSPVVNAIVVYLTQFAHQLMMGIIQTSDPFSPYLKNDTFFFSKWNKINSLRLKTELYTIHKKVLEHLLVQSIIQTTSFLQFLTVFFFLSKFVWMTASLTFLWCGNEIYRSIYILPLPWFAWRFNAAHHQNNY